MKSSTEIYFHNIFIKLTVLILFISDWFDDDTIFNFNDRELLVSAVKKKEGENVIMHKLQLQCNRKIMKPKITFFQQFSTLLILMKPCTI